MKKILIVVDMQNDFIDGALGTKEAAAIVPAVVDEIQRFKADGSLVLYTRDTHHDDYLNTQEGKKLPVVHCLEGTEGWKLRTEIQALADGAEVFDKPTFGSVQLAQYVCELATRQGGVDLIELVGLCTDICVIANAMLLKAFLPETEIAVKADCCAGVTPQSHNNALEAMKMCQIGMI